LKVSFFRYVEQVADQLHLVLHIECSRYHSGLRLRADISIDVQLLNSLITLSTSSLLGALPVPLSTALQSSTNSRDSPSVAELTIWEENRAGLEFSRREAVRASGRAVLDVMRGSGR